MLKYANQSTKTQIERELNDYEFNDATEKMKAQFYKIALATKREGMKDLLEALEVKNEEGLNFFKVNTDITMFGENRKWN